MRGKLFCLCLLMAAVFCLSSCVQVINTPADELRMYSWQGECDNGNTASLSFENQNGYLTITGGDFSQDIGGLCVFSDDRIIICDEESGFNYSFGYRLYGDKVELSYNSSEISLKKSDAE